MWEGDGSIIKRERGDQYFVITQCNSDLQMVHYVRNTLGFGRVHVQGETTSRFVVQDLANLYKLQSILNGNIVLPKRQRQFKSFCKAYNEKAKRNGTWHCFAEARAADPGARSQTSSYSK